MSRLLRFVLMGVAGFAVLLIVVVMVGLSFIDSLAHKGVEAGGTYALGVNTTLESMNIGIMRGRVSLEGLKVDNPKGFDAPTFLTLADARTKVALGSLRQDVVVVPELYLSGIDVNLQRTPDGKTNYKVILENLERLSGPEKPPPKPDESEKRLIINDLVIQNVTVHAAFAPPGAIGEAMREYSRVTIPISEIRLQDVGKTGKGVAGSGITLGELSGLIVEAILSAAVHHGGNLLPADLVGDLKGQLAKLGNLEGVKKAFGDVTEGIGEIVKPEEVGDVLRKGTEGIRDLIPGRDRR